MGSQASKSEQSPQQKEAPEDNLKTNICNDTSQPSTPILTPSDPRSPSVNIARTPLELILGTKTLTETPIEKIQESNVVKNVLLGIDPRSPTVEFNRTPIVVATITKDMAKPQNKNLDNVRKSQIQTTPLKTVEKCSKIIPPKLLESSPISRAPAINPKRKSLVGLLETNIDFTETDLDSVCNNGIEPSNITLPAEEDQIIPSLDENDTVPDCDESNDKVNVVENFHCEETYIAEENDTEKNCNKTTEEKTINVTAQVKDFDKKLTNLIYQDDSEEDDRLILRFAKIKEGSRTPLSDKNSNGESNSNRKIVGTKLKVSDKPRKSEGSRIPVLKCSGKKVGIQCENTPPRKMEDKSIKTKMSRWDADKSLVI